MSSTILLSFCGYLTLIFCITYWVQYRGTTSNRAFFLASRAVPWWVVAIGMIGDSISGVTFVSVPGMVEKQAMSYLQLCLGFFLGYIIVAYILLPRYYRWGYISIYTYLKERYGPVTYRTGAIVFVVSKLVGAAAKLYLITLILHSLVFASLGIPYPMVVLCVVGLIWLYTRGGGMATIVWTDVLQTVCLVLALILITYSVIHQMGIDLPQAYDFVRQSPLSKIWVWDDWQSPIFAPKQILSGLFIVVVMTGLDQNMIQKNLTCKTLKEAQKNMLSYGISFIPLNALFLALGILLLAYAQSRGIELPTLGDERLPFLAANYLGTGALICFTLGITAASCSNADSALTSLTTSICVDILGIDDTESKQSHRIRQRVHLSTCLLFAIVILAISTLGQGSVLNAIFVAVSYTYGPLLGLYGYGLGCKRRVKDRFTPYVCILSPLLCFVLDYGLQHGLGYKMGYELLLINGLLTALGLWLVREP